ncbi:MAG: hypothetical protein NUV54_01070 [Candidatus Taylorbacteria bacterium]|nr:hypothetical protein [Candidatus Taylorbacteria bacterium]
MANISTSARICPDCGPATVNHLVAKTSVTLGFLIRVITTPLSKIEDAIVKILFPYIEYGMPYLFKFLSLLGLGELTDEMREDNIDRTKCMWRAAQERGITIRQFRILGRPSIIFFAEYGGKRIMFEGLPRPQGGDHSSLTWMDNKGIMREKFREGGIPVAQGGVVMTKQKALSLFKTLTPPVITKPNLGSRSRHTTTHITTEAGVFEGFRKANQLSLWVVLEEELQGFVYRITLIGGKLEGALRREPPFVTGDGVATVRALVEKENQNPKRHNWVFHEIAMDKDAEEELKRQGLSWESIPEKGTFVALNQKVGRGQGGSNTEMLSRVHPDNVVLFEKIGKVLGDALVGIDFIMQDIEKPWTEQKRIGAIECNSLPFLDLHHMPLYGEPLDPSGKLWDVVFPEAKKVFQS